MARTTVTDDNFVFVNGAVESTILIEEDEEEDSGLTFIRPRTIPTPVRTHAVTSVINNRSSVIMTPVPDVTSGVNAPKTLLRSAAGQSTTSTAFASQSVDKKMNSKIWDHVSLIDSCPENAKRVRCRCGQTFSYSNGTSHINRHIVSCGECVKVNSNSAEPLLAGQRLLNWNGGS